MPGRDEVGEDVEGITTPEGALYPFGGEIDEGAGANAPTGDEENDASIDERAGLRARRGMRTQGAEYVRLLEGLWGINKCKGAQRFWYSGGAENQRSASQASLDESERMRQRS